MFDHSQRLDAAERVWFNNELQAFDMESYRAEYPALFGQAYIPTQPNIPEWKRVYSWKLIDHDGNAKIVSGDPSDIPLIQVKGTENHQSIKTVAAAYGYELDEIKAARASGTPLDQDQRMATQYEIESKCDAMLAVGDAPNGIEGLLTLAASNAYTLSQKAHGIGNGTAWTNSAGQVVATVDEILQDVNGMVAARLAAIRQSGGPQFQRFTLLLPVVTHAAIAGTRTGDGSNEFILNLLMRNRYIEAIEPWHYCDTAGTNGRMQLYPRSRQVIAGLMPQQFMMQPPQQRDLFFKINCTAKCGGVVVRYPFAIAHADQVLPA